MKKILVAYASRYGSTAEVAQAIGAQLSQRGATVDVCSVADVRDLASYDAVVVGSAIRMGQWLGAATKFVEANQAALRQVPVAFFTLHILALGDGAASQQERATAHQKQAFGVHIP